MNQHYPYKPLSTILPGYLNGKGFDMEKGMWVELLTVDWRMRPYYHSGYEGNKWFASPGYSNDFFINELSTMYQLESEHNEVVLERIAHGESKDHFLRIKNRDDEDFGGLVQNGKYLSPSTTAFFYANYT